MSRPIKPHLMLHWRLDYKPEFVNSLIMSTFIKQYPTEKQQKQKYGNFKLAISHEITNNNDNIELDTHGWLATENITAPWSKFMKTVKKFYPQNYSPLDNFHKTIQYQTYFKEVWPIVAGNSSDVSFLSQAYGSNLRTGKIERIIHDKKSVWLVMIDDTIKLTSLPLFVINKKIDKSLG